MRGFLKWLLPEGRLNSGGSSERERAEVVGIKRRGIKRDGRKRCSRKMRGCRAGHNGEEQTNQTLSRSTFTFTSPRLNTSDLIIFYTIFLLHTIQIKTSVPVAGPV